MSTDHQFRRSNFKLTVNIVVDDIKTVLVVQRREVGLGNSKANSTGDTLTERASCELDA